MSLKQDSQFAWTLSKNEFIAQQAVFLSYIPTEKIDSSLTTLLNIPCQYTVWTAK